MDRRKAIKRISLSFGSMTVSTGLISIVQSCQSDDSLKNLKFFNTTQISFLDRVLEIILPETETPGAISLNLSKFVDAYVSKNIKSEDQKYLFALIDEFISMIVKSENVNSIDQVCGLVREMAVNSYKLTEYVMTNKLGFVPIPGYYDGNVDI
jgi:hypothetical protein